MRRILLPLLLTATGLWLVGCAEATSVIHVNRDGAGYIVERRLTTRALEQKKHEIMMSLAKEKPETWQLEVEGLEVPAPEPDLEAIYDEAIYQQRASLMGAELKGVKRVTGPGGMYGVEAVYTFDNIGTVRLPMEVDSAVPLPPEEREKAAIRFAFVKRGDYSVLTLEMPSEAPSAETLEKAAEQEVDLQEILNDRDFMSLVREANRFTVAVELHDAEVLETNALHVGDRKKRITLLDVDARRAVNDRAGWKRFDEFGKHFRDVFAEVQPLLAGEERQELLDGLEEAARKPSAAEREAAAKELVAWVEEQRETEFSELSRERLQKLLGGLAGVFARYDAQQVRQGMEQLADLAVLRKKLEALARTVVDTQQTIAWIPEAIKEQRQELETGLAADRSAEEMEAMRERIRELERTREKLEGTLRELKPKYEEAIAAAKKAMTELADQTAAVRRELLDLSREIAAEALEDVPETVRVDPQWQITVHYGRPGTTLPDVLAAEAGR